MKNFVLMAACAFGLSACAVASGNNTGFLDDGKDVSFLRDGVNSCGNLAGINPIYARYPMRCGPQTQR